MTTATILSHATEMSKARFWQETALRAMQSLIAVQPPPPVDVDTAEYRDWLSRIASQSWELAEKMYKGHGPSIEPEMVRFSVTTRGEND